MSAAYVDTKTNKIYGCKKYSLAWWHEKGHIIYAKSKYGSRLHYYQENLLRFLMVSIVGGLFFDFSKWIALFILVAYMYMDVFEENWCWNYAIWHFEGKKKIR